MRLYFPVDLTGNLIMIEKLVLGEIWTGDLPIFNPDALTSAPSWQAIHENTARITGSTGIWPLTSWSDPHFFIWTLTDSHFQAPPPYKFLGMCNLTPPHFIWYISSTAYLSHITIFIVVLFLGTTVSKIFFGNLDAA